MMHVAIFPTWSCQLSCAYCSIRNSKIDRTVAPVPWQVWADALKSALGPGSIVDVAGGEPLLYDGIIPLLHALGGAGIRWALTTNAKATEKVKQICWARPRGGVCINVSDHAGNPEAHEAVHWLRDAGYFVNVHRVSHPAAGHHEHDAREITYQDWIGGQAVDGKRRHCTAGINHWVADPRGDMWRCVVALETGQPSNGNLFTRELAPIKAECDFGCSACYTENPGEWGVEMREL
jgi:hypothetical protein